MLRNHSLSETPMLLASGFRLSVRSLMSRVVAVKGSYGQDVVEGLSQAPRSIPTYYLYDDYGSELFEQICIQPEYYPTRTERQILRRAAPEIASITKTRSLVELGSGSSSKTRLLLDGMVSYWEEQPVYYVPIDVSAGILERSAMALLDSYPTLTVQGLVATYELALADLPPVPDRLVAFLGSTLGNIPPHECDHFFAQVAEALAVGEYFLIGVDLQKDIAILEAAYNDQAGVSAAFNLNILNHLNRRFGGTFIPAQFRHYAPYNPTAHQIEIYVTSDREQTVTLGALSLSLHLSAGEKILTEVSRKFQVSELRSQLASLGFMTQGVWTDSQDWYAVMLLQKN
ncbi:MAG: L-histidine N(alpha)-methyltransferase [Oscillatoriales cyanobacterium SM2_2_1]|nr:L-histidine N(alpha)-methyltransferase [Oscillatoriales cyanobacterium SM2_2_1]